MSDNDDNIINNLLNDIDNNEDTAVVGLLSDMHFADISEVLNIATSRQRCRIIELIKDDFDAEILIDIDPRIRDEVLDMLGAKESAKAITSLEYDDTIEIIEELELDDKSDILDSIPKTKRDDINKSLEYAKDSAGRIMNTAFVAVPYDWNIGQVIDYLRSGDNFSDIFYSIFVVDKDKKPIGYLPVSKAITRERAINVHDIMHKKLHLITLDMDQEEIAYIFRKYAIASAPVIDDNNIIVGVITIDDVVDIIDEEAQEDILHMGGVNSATDIYSAFTTTAFKRFPWLFVNLLTAIAASVVIAFFAQEIEQMVVLAVLMPIIASMAGNAGTQTLTIAVRAIATKELTSINAMRVVKKEILAAILNGALFAIIVSVISFILYQDVYLSAVFGAATMISLIIAALCGALIPISLVRLKVDPAIASSVFLTTATDMSAFFIFLWLASSWLL